MSKRYRLKKDLPGLKAGEIFVYDGDAWYDSENKDIYNEINHYAPKCVHNNSEWFEEIHQPKEDKPEWEIVSFWCNGKLFELKDDGNYHHPPPPDCHANVTAFNPKYGDKIHSVKRLSDGEVFSVGDLIQHNSWEEAVVHPYKIEGFDIRNEIMMVKLDCHGFYMFSEIKKSKPKEELKEPERGCGICGGKMVFIRGKYPGMDKREVCPTCNTERLEQINEISSKSYGQAYQVSENQSSLK